jgi:hypothetical protein
MFLVVMLRMAEPEGCPSVSVQFESIPKDSLNASSITSRVSLHAQRWLLQCKGALLCCSECMHNLRIEHIALCGVCPWCHHLLAFSATVLQDCWQCTSVPVLDGTLFKPTCFRQLYTHLARARWAPNSVLLSCIKGTR